MAEYIERESIYKILLMENPFGWNNDDLAELFREAKAADVAPVVHGRWIYKGDSDMWVCSRCGRSVNADPEGIDLYCYHCGAKMDESEDKNEIF